MMRVLEDNPRVSQREIASTLGISVGAVNYCLRAVVAKGMVKVENYRNSKNKVAYLYLLTPSGIAAKAELTRRFLARRLQEYNELRVEIEHLRAQLPEDERAAIGLAGVVGPTEGAHTL